MFAKSLTLAVIVPIFNPPKFWRKEFESSLVELEESLKNISFCLVLVNDGSEEINKDLEILNQNFSNLSILSYPKNMGKGFAIKHGLKNVEAENYIYCDWDFPFNVQTLHHIFILLQNEEMDICVGQRNKSYFDNLPLLRRLVSYSLRIFTKVFFGGMAIDSQSGLKGLNQKAKIIFLENFTNSFVFEIEFIKNALSKNLKFCFVDIYPKESIEFSDLKFRTIFMECINLLKIIFVKR